MAKQSTTETCCLTLPLRLEKWQEDKLEKRLECARQIYNTLLSYEIKKLKRLEKTEEYSSITDQIKALYDENKNDSQDLKELYKRRNLLLKEAGFTEYSFKSDVKACYKHFKDNIGSNVAFHGIAPRVWVAFEKMLFKNGKAVHFKRRGEVDSVQSNKSEIYFRGSYIEWKGLKLSVKLDSDNTYETEMLQKRVKYCRINKKTGKYKNRWYVQLILEGKPAVKVDKTTGKQKHPIGKGTVGIDIGPQTIAYVSETEVDLRELADRVDNIERKKLLLQRKMDRSRRAMNPNLFNNDGTVKRGIKLNWNNSKNYFRIRRELSFLQAKQAEIRKRQHNDLANHLLSLGDRFYIEDMNWNSLTRRAKNTEKSEKTGKFKRKKRFGKSVANKAPAMLVTLLGQKSVSRGIEGVKKVPTKVKASQFNHFTGEYQKKSLSQRWNVMPNGERVQRDIYSAFLLQHTNQDLDGFDIEGLNNDYDSFIILHDEVIKRLTRSEKTLSSMGIRRTAG